MRVKYLKRNLKNFRKLLKKFARQYKMRVHFESRGEDRYLWVTFQYKSPQHVKYINIIRVDEYRIACGVYAPALAAKNIERQVLAWLKVINVLL